jgi:hypothetical protein
MISARFFLLVAFVIFGHFATWVSGHAYFTYPTPRNAYCANITCTSNGTLGSQGPVWSLPANTTLSVASPATQTTCNGSGSVTNATLGSTYDPGFQGITTATWQAGSSQTFQIFISQIHLSENQTIYPTDGWQIRYRDGTQSGSTFSPIAFTYVNVSTSASIGPTPGIGFQIGQTVLATITVPSNATTDGIFQFFWRNNEISVMWLSCADVTITAFGIMPVPSIFIMVLVTLSAMLNI